MKTKLPSHLATRAMVAVACAVVLAGCAHAPARERSPRAAEAAPRPNIVLIMSDDLDLRSLDHLPRVRSLLAREGVAFFRYFASSPICAPSRASLLTGQYAHNHRVLTNTPPDGGFERFRASGHQGSTVATWLQAAGYRTLLAGKYMNGYPEEDAATRVPKGWNEWFGLTTREKYFGYHVNENGTWKLYGNAPEDYETDVLATKAADFIRRSAADRQPFFAYIAPSAPHFRPIAAPRHAGAFAESRAPRTPSFNEADVSTKPAWVQAQSALTPEDELQIDQLWRERMQTLLAVDELVGTIVEALKASGQLGNTYVFFTSDNGFHLGEHRVQKGKGTPYEESIRLPLVVRGPGVPRGKTLAHLATNVDLAPTFAELGRAQPPAKQLDGRSLVGLLSRRPMDAGSWRQELLAEYWAADDEGVPSWAALRTEKLTYVEYATGEREMYDLTQDPHELNNLIAAAPPEEVDALSERLARLRQCRAAACSGEAVDSSGGGSGAPAP